MRDLSHFGALPKGLAFEIEDLLLVKDWAELNDVRFAVRLDHGSEHEEYDEVIALQTDAQPYLSLLLWRNSQSVFVQPLIGRNLAFGSVGEALASLPVREDVVLTDITATAWPGGSWKGSR
jgi:hypothetical protein